MKTWALAVLALLLLPIVNVSAQERCVENPQSTHSPAELARIAQLRGFGNLSPEEEAELRSLETKPGWAANVGAGNGWFDDGPDSCVLYISASGEPVLGTRIYSPRLLADRVDAPTGSALQATVVDGPARIRSGPGLDFPRLIWCDQGLSLTVWLPAEGGWLRASCYGANGWIHQSLVQIDDARARPDTQITVPGDLPLPTGGEQATVIAGPARIRGGPGQQHPRLAWCANGSPLTVFPPVVGDWLPASCFGANGWIHAALVEYDDTPAQPALAPVAPGDASRPASGQRATVIAGPARIRGGPGQQHPRLAWCANGSPLTVFPPVVGDWLPASCFGANGWIHAALVEYDDTPAQPALAPVAPGDASRPASGQRATVIAGPARIRGGPGQQHPRPPWTIGCPPVAMAPMAGYTQLWCKSMRRPNPPRRQFRLATPPCPPAESRRQWSAAPPASAAAPGSNTPSWPGARLARR
ncbi:MAG: hypothetical protein OXF32_07475 [Anaerolineaceae bacterium]|nr:hypothetical protein [Anaerolineaceae bacterium]